MSACWPLQGMTVAQKAVLISLADNANDHGVCWPAVDTIAMRCCLSDRAVQNAIVWLQKAGAIKLLRKTGRSTTYTVTPISYVEPTPEPGSPPKRVHPRSIFTPNGVHPTPERRSPPPPNGVHQPPNGVHPNRKEPPVEPQRNRNADQKPVDDPFQKFWDAWPKSERKVDKADCRKHWDREKLDAKAPVIIAHVQAMKLSEAWRTGFEPMPSTYLHGKRWEDELPPSATGEEVEADPRWWLSSSATERQGKALGIERRQDEPNPDYLIRVAHASGRGPWIDHVLAQERKGNDQRFQKVLNFFGDALIPADFV